MLDFLALKGTLKKNLGAYVLVKKPPNPVGVLRKKIKGVDYLRSRNKKKTFCSWERQGQKQDKNSNFQLFLAHLVLLALVGRPRFHLVAWVLGLVVGLAMGGVILTGVDVAVDFLR